jgi:hypothetical protein
MSIVLRITSADGKHTIMKTLPGLPSHIKVPAGARIEVMDPSMKRVESLAMYINRHANEDDRHHRHHHDDDGDQDVNSSQVTLETAPDWAATEAWFESVGQMAETNPSGPDWFYTGSEHGEGKIIGYDKSTLLVGGLVGAGAIGAGIALSGGGGPKDEIAPAAPRSLDLAAADDNGVSNSDNITTQTSNLTISGASEIGASVELFDGATSLGKTKADASGVFTLDVSLADGTHSITAKATDSAGNVSAESTALSITVDTTTPTAPTALALAAADDTGASATDGITRQTTALTITGTAEANSTVELFDGTTSLGTATASATGTFTKDVALAGGSHAITAKTTDAAGHTSDASAVLTIVVDATVPVAPTGLDLAAADDTGSSSTDNITSKTSDLTISGTAEAGTTVELFEGSTSLGTATADANGVFSRDISLSAGAHSITARSTDVAGNTSALSTALVIAVDTSVATPAGPDLASTDDSGASATDNVTSRTTGLTVSGTAEANGTVELFDGTNSLGVVNVASNGTYTLDLTLAAGTHSITAKPTDASGNSGAASDALVIVVDTTAPTAPSSLDLAAAVDTGRANTDNITNRTSGLTITGTTEAGAIVELFDGTTSLGTVAAGANGVFSRDVSLIEGSHSISAKATDLAGNVSAASSVLNVTVDTTAPTPPAALDLAAADDDGTSSNDNVTSKTSDLTISGTAEAGATIELFDGAFSLGTVTAANDGTFSRDITLGIGNHAVTAKATDAAGNFGSASAVLNISVVATPAAESLVADGLPPASELDHLALANSSSSFG